MTFYPIAPVAAPRMTRRDKWLNRPIVAEYFAFRNNIRARGIEIPIPSKVTFWVKMPDSWSRKKRELMLRQPHEQTPDIDNFLKAILEAVFDKKDAKVWSIWPEKRWSNNPGIEVIPL